MQEQGSPDAAVRYAMKVGGVTIGVESTAPDLGPPPSGPGRRFLVAFGSHDLSLRVGWGATDPRAGGALVFDSGATWRLYEQDGRPVYRFFHPALGATPYKEARLELDGSHGSVQLDRASHSGHEPVDPLQFPLDELLFLRLFAERRAVELHACGVVAPSGEGYVLAGQSGDGKTTMARLWSELPGAQILSDDRVVVRHEGGTWWMYGTPWHGEGQFAANARAPLRALLLLGRGDRNAFERMAPAEAVSEVLARSFVPLHDPKAVAQSLEQLERLSADVPCLRFRFVPDGTAVHALLSGLP